MNTIRAWSLKAGFDIRFGSKKSLANGEMSTFHFLWMISVLSQHCSNFPCRCYLGIGILECVHAKKPSSTKHQNPEKWKDRVSIRTDCKALVKIFAAYKPNSPWRITLINNEHNHRMIPGAAEYSWSARALTPEMLGLIGSCPNAMKSMPAARAKLQSQYPGKYFHGQTISNALAKFRRSRPNPHGNEAMDLMRMLLEKKQRDPEWFVEMSIDNISHQLDRVFWMNPQQRMLYGRYHDVVFNDTTAQTNRFKMGLNVTVAIDNLGASRVVALALIRSEGGVDFDWVCTQLLKASGGKAPGVLLVDEDRAMEVACKAVFPDTQIVNCVWHVAQNFGKQLGRHMKNKDHAAGFWRVHNVMTVQEFEEEWSKLVDEYSDNEKIKGYLERVYKRRFHWARPWTGTCFTAGAESTQRVEKMHELIKRSLTQKSSLMDLLRAIEEKVASEEQTKAHLSYTRELKMIGPQDVAESLKYFLRIDEENKRYLGEFGLFQMKKQMAAAFYYDYQVLEVKSIYLYHQCVLPKKPSN